MKKLNKYVEDEEGIKHDRTRDKWKKAYRRLQEQTKPIWGEFLVVQDDFFRKYKSSDGAFSEQWAIKVMPHFDKCLKEREVYLFEYWDACKNLGVVSRDINGQPVSPYKY
jgi:hypothetical protein